MALASGRGHLARQWHVPRLPSAVLPVATATATASPAASVQWLSRVINPGELRGRGQGMRLWYAYPLTGAKRSLVLAPVRAS